jgi:glycosyltransferase involved in cell wall biosynthesis
MYHGPLISIIIPVFNGEKYIANSLSQIVSQTFSNFEVIVLNSMSTDSTSEIVMGYVQDNPNVRLINEKDNGIFDGMNRGVEYSKGKWLLFLGCDDLLYSDFVLEEISTYLDGTSDVVYGDVMWVPENIPEVGEVTALGHLNRCINHQRIFYERDLFEKHGNYNCVYDVAADHDLNIRFYCNPVIKWRHVPMFITKYFSGGNSSYKYDLKMWRNWDEVVRIPFSRLLPKKEIYRSFNQHYRELLNRRFYPEALFIALKINSNVRSLGFLLLHFTQFIKSFRTKQGE